MKLRKAKPEELKSPNAETLRKRAETLSEDEVIDGLEQFASNLSKYIGAYRRTRPMTCCARYRSPDLPYTL